MKEFYKGKSIVVTGGAGFIGSRLVDILVGYGANVLVLDNTSRHKMAGLENYEKNPDAYYGFVDCGGEDFGAYLKKIDIVFNLAAHVAGVTYNVDHQSEMFTQNVRLQVDPVTAAVKAGVRMFLQVSSVCVYSPRHNHPSLEEDGFLLEPHVANNGYGWSKRMGEKAAMWHASKFEKIVRVRPSNVYGPGDWFDAKAHVVPALIKKVDEATDTVKLHGSGNEVRELVYVEDTAMAMVHAMANGKHGRVYNIGSRFVTKMGDLLLTIMDIMGKQSLEIITTPDAQSGDPLRWTSYIRLREDTGWDISHTNPIENLENTIRYYFESVKVKA